MSLLNFVVNTVKTHFPELHSFAQGLQLEDATQGLSHLLVYLGVCQERGGGGGESDPSPPIRRAEEPISSMSRGT